MLLPEGRDEEAEGDAGEAVVGGEEGGVRMHTLGADGRAATAAGAASPSTGPRADPPLPSSSSSAGSNAGALPLRRGLRWASQLSRVGEEADEALGGRSRRRVPATLCFQGVCAFVVVAVGLTMIVIWARSAKDWRKVGLGDGKLRGPIG